MRFEFTLLLLFLSLLLDIANSFSSLYSRALISSKYSTNTKLASSAYQTSDTDEFLSRFTEDELKLLPTVSLSFVGKQLLSQFGLFGLSAVLYPVANIKWPTINSIDSGSLTIGVLYLAGFMGFTVWLYFLSEKQKQSIEYINLLYMGKSTTSRTVFLFTLLLAIAVGVTKEVLFRGLFLNLFNNWFGIVPAIVLSSLLLSLSFQEVGVGLKFSPPGIIFGVLMGVAYIQSGFNLFVPVFIHVFHLCFFDFFCWKRGRDNYKSKFISGCKVSDLPKKIETVCSQRFVYIDYDGDGRVGKDDFLALSIVVGSEKLGFPFLEYFVTSDETETDPGAMFGFIDSDGDGFFDLNDYIRTNKESVKKWILM